MSSIERNLNSFDEDIFGRRVISENLTKIIESQDEPIVISLDSEWGTGKTTFVKMWKHMLDSNKRFKTIYFNAWENDYIKDPLIALFSELEEQINEESGELKQTFNKVKKTITPLLKSAAIIGIKVGTAGILDLEKIDLGDNTEESIISTADKLGEFAIKEIKVSRDVRRKFKEVMDEFQKKADKKIIFFIDELDRCRPTFSIELLEVIKHLFDINNCVFIISIDKEQLSHSVATIYGSNMDTIGYLRRFFDLDYKLPNIDLRKYIETKENIFENKYNVDLFMILVKEKFVAEKFSLRDIDKACYYIRLLIPLIKEFNTNQQYNKVYIAIISYLYATLITAKIKKPLLYKQIIDGDYVVEDIMIEFNDFSLNYYKEQLIDCWSQEVLQGILDKVLRPFLTLNLIYKKEGSITTYNKNEFVVKLYENGDEFDWDKRFDLVRLFNTENTSLMNKLEFVDSFEIR